MGGATSIVHFAGRYGPDVRVVRAVRRARGPGVCAVPGCRATFFVCRADLEDELIRALGVDGVLQVIEAAGDGPSWRRMRAQPAQRDRPVEQQLRRFMGTRSGRKERYAGAARRARWSSIVRRPRWSTSCATPPRRERWEMCARGTAPSRIALGVRRWRGRRTSRARRWCGPTRCGGGPRRLRLGDVGRDRSRSWARAGVGVRVAVCSSAATARTSSRSARPAAGAEELADSARHRPMAIVGLGSTSSNAS